MSLELVKEIPLRYDKATTIEEATRIYNEVNGMNQLWYKKVLVHLGSNVSKIKRQKMVLLDDILLGLALTYGLDVNDIKGSSRKRIMLLPRQCITYTLVKKYKFDIKSTGECVGRDHSTAIHSIRLVENWIQTKYGFDEELRLLKMIYPEKFES